jgi:hypothetical protein
MASLGDGFVFLVNQNRLDSCGTEFYTKDGLACLNG